MLARHNPFATDRVERLLRFNPEWSGITWEGLDEKWESLGRRATVTGRHGAGKTCFLDAWAKRHEHNYRAKPLRIFLNREQKTLTEGQWQAIAQCEGKVVILDGEEQLHFRARNTFYKLTKHAYGTLVARHSRGKLSTLLHLDPGADLLADCVKILAPQHYTKLSPMFPTWWKKHQGNLRSILLECYDKTT